MLAMAEAMKLKPWNFSISLNKEAMVFIPMKEDHPKTANLVNLSLIWTKEIC